MILFSIITPTYNRRSLLERTLLSVAMQTCSDYEVIVADDGSTDGTVAWLQERGGAQVVTQANRGPGAARNLAVEHARGQYLAFLDSDDLWFPWSLATYAAVIRQHGGPAFIAGKPFCFENEAALANVAAEPLQYQVFADYLASGDEWRWWGASSFVVRAEAFRAVGGFAEANINGEDGDLALKMGTAQGFVQITSPATFAYREHAGNVTANLSKSLAGVWHQIHSEQASLYPGGQERARQRRRILTRHARPMSLDCLREELCVEAWKLYRAILPWNVALGRWKYLVGFPVKTLFP